jgi:hypothetical protein
MYLIKYGLWLIPVDIHSLEVLRAFWYGNAYYVNIVGSVIAGALIGVCITRISDCVVAGLREIYRELTE